LIVKVINEVERKENLVLYSYNLILDMVCGCGKVCEKENKLWLKN